LLSAGAADGFKFVLELKQAALDAATVGFELRFTRSSGSDATAELRHGFTPAGEAWEHVFKLGELDLQLAFAGAGVAREDVEDELGAIDGAARQGVFKVAKLRGAEIVIEDDNVGLRRRSDAVDLLDFAAADERGRISFGAPLLSFRNDVGTGAGDEFAELFEPGIVLVHGCRESRT
jgi:hypothetical protein